VAAGAQMGMSDLLVAAEAAEASFAFVQPVPLPPPPGVKGPEPQGEEVHGSAEEEEDESSSDDSSDEEEAVGGEQRHTKLREKVSALCADEEDAAGFQEPPRTKNEVVEAVTVEEETGEELVALVDEGSLVGPVGAVASVLPSAPPAGAGGKAPTPEHGSAGPVTVVVQGSEGSAALNEGSVLCLGNRVPLGTVNEVFGPIKVPHYLLHLSARVVEAAGEALVTGGQIFTVQDQSHYVTLATIIRGKGCDASNEHDEELPPEQQDYSDDEEERSAKQKHRAGRKAAAGAGNSAAASGSPRRATSRGQREAGGPGRQGAPQYAGTPRPPMPSPEMLSAAPGSWPSMAAAPGNMQMAQPPVLAPTAHFFPGYPPGMPPGPAPRGLPQAPLPWQPQARAPMGHWVPPPAYLASALPRPRPAPAASTLQPHYVHQGNGFFPMPTAAHSPAPPLQYPPTHTHQHPGLAPMAAALPGRPPFPPPGPPPRGY